MRQPCNPIAAAALAAACLMPAIAQAQARDFPSKPIHIIVPLPPGGSNDVLARVLGQEMSTTFGQPVVVENKPGAAGNIGTAYVAKSAPDGYTLGIAPNQTVGVNPVLFTKLPFDAEKDLTGVSLLARLPMLLVVPGKSKIHSIADLVAAAKAEPGKLTYAAAGAGSPQRMSSEIFQSLTGTSMTQIPYKGSVPALVDVVAGSVDLMFCPINSTLQYLHDGRLRALGVTTAKRLPDMPDVPTIAEAVPGFESGISIGMVAPAATPRDVIGKINAELRRALALPAVQKTLAEQGITAESSTPEEFDREMAADRKRSSEIIKRAHIQVDG